MGYSFTLPKGIAFRVKKEGVYPWPWDGDKDRTIELFTDDVLTKQENGKYMKHTGLGCLNIVRMSGAGWGIRPPSSICPAPLPRYALAINYPQAKRRSASA